MCKDNLNKINLRAGTDLTYNKMRGSGRISRTIRDIAFIKPKDDVHIALSLRTGFTALGETPEEAYSSLVFKLYNSLREVVDYPDAQIGKTVSEELKKECLYALRMPEDRQMKALLKGIDAFLSIPREDSKLYLRRIESNPTPTTITTQDLEDTVIDVNILDTSESSNRGSHPVPVYQA